jgi:Ca2+/H+ antiporter, TMEM165/GDT1 family
VVALVFALGADHSTLRHGTYGAVSGTAVVALVALGFGAALIALPHWVLLWASAVVLAAFGVFLFRSTLRTYRRQRAAASGAGGAPRQHAIVQFAGGFTVGAVEATETVVVLLALSAAGYGSSAIVGAVVGGTILVIAALLVHEQIRKIKVPWLKLGATSVIFSFAVFWAGEAVGFAWPGSDLFLIPLFVLSLVIVRGGLELFLRRSTRPSNPS